MRWSSEREFTMTNRPDDYQIGKLFLETARQTLGDCRKKIHHCVEQISEEDLWWRPFEAQNSIANIVLHLCGNIGQWIISGIGGAPDVRERPKEFAARHGMSKAKLLQQLAGTIHKAEEALANFDAAELPKTRHIQHWDVSALEAIFHATSHFEGHTHQIVYITRLRLGDRYKFLGLDAKSD